MPSSLCPSSRAFAGAPGGMLHAREELGEARLHAEQLASVKQQTKAPTSHEVKEKHPNDFPALTGDGLPHQK